jgi:hypothetical protein
MSEVVYMGGASAPSIKRKKLKKSPHDKMVRPEQVKTK